MKTKNVLNLCHNKMEMQMQIYPHYIKQTCIVSELANWTLLSEDRFLR